VTRGTTALLEARRRDPRSASRRLDSRACLDLRRLAVSLAHPVHTAAVALVLPHAVPVVPVAMASAPLSTTAAADRAMQGMRAVLARRRRTTAALHALLARGAAVVLAPVSCATPAASATSPRRRRLAAPATATLHLGSDALPAPCRALAQRAAPDRTRVAAPSTALHAPPVPTATPLRWPPRRAAAAVSLVASAMQGRRTAVLARLASFVLAWRALERRCSCVRTAMRVVGPVPTARLAAAVRGVLAAV
jgi:hypothetical protein